MLFLSYFCIVFDDSAVQQFLELNYYNKLDKGAVTKWSAGLHVLSLRI